MSENANQKENDIKKVITKASANAKELIAKDIVDVTAINKVRKIDFYTNAAMSWLNDYGDGAYLGCYSNKLGDVVVALYHDGVIYLIGESYKTIMYAPKIMFHMVDVNHIHIDDVLVKHNSVGNGSIAMTAFLIYSQNNGVNVITGDLSCIDEDHENRRNEYYKKFGFKIMPGKVIKYI